MSLSERIGKKAANLVFLKKNNFNIPESEVINSNTISFFLSSLKIEEGRLGKIFFSLSEKEAINELKAIRKRILFSKEKIKIPKLSAQNLIIRSSSNLEDSSESSFAGIFESKRVSNNEEEIKRGIKNVLAESFSEKVYYYLKNKNIKEIPKISLLVQEFIEGDVSGVLFTKFRKNALSGFLINANYGTAESVVKGEKPESIFIEHGKENNLQNKNSLTKIQLNILLKDGKRIEKLFKKPQDIEFTFKNNKIYILQSRPITFLHQETRVWDNSNIVESYSGVVLPLTASFARRAYKIAYINLVKLMGINSRKILEYEDVFENLLGFFYGRFYYNMLNWYRMASLFPGYEKNRQNLNNMISAKTIADLDREYIENVSFFFKLRFYGTIALLYPFYGLRIKNFKSLVRRTFLNFRKKETFKLTSKELITIYNSLEYNLLRKWSITLENDFLLMTLYGKLREFTGSNNMTEQDIIELISNIKNLASAKQVKRLSSLSKEFYKYSELIKLAKKKYYTQCFSEIKTNKKYSELKDNLELYLSDYGGRFANELRLEVKNLDEDPSYIINLLLIYNSSYKNTEEISTNRNYDLTLLKSIYLNILIKNIKYYARLREDLRLLRSQAFGIVRQIFKEIGKRFENEGAIKNQEDIFYLDIEEIKNYINGSSSMQNLISIISLRKAEYNSYKKKHIDNLFTTEGNPYASIPEKKSTNKNNLLLGKGCSGGIIKGKVTVLKEFALPKNGSYEIVVAKNTDPGWTPLFGLCKGIIIEQGGLLSHAAIVARELRLPCVISVEGAMSKLKNGDIITINGFTGEIIKHGKKKDN